MANLTKKLQKALANKSESEMKIILQDLLTLSEIEDFEARLKIFGLLNQGMTQREIAQKLAVSISKVTRGANALKISKGGYKLLVD